MNVNYKSKLAMRIISSNRPRIYEVGQILTLDEIGNHWTGYTKDSGKGYSDFEYDKYNYLFEVKDVNVRVVNYLDENEAQSIECHDECEVHMPSDYKFEVIATDTDSYKDEDETYEEAYERRCRQDVGFETITLKILNNQEIETEFDLEAMIEAIEEKLEEELENLFK